MGKYDKNTFSIYQNLEDHDYVYPTVTELTKNHQGGNKQRNIDYADQ